MKNRNHIRALRIWAVTLTIFAGMAIGFAPAQAANPAHEKGTATQTIKKAHEEITNLLRQRDQEKEGSPRYEKVQDQLTTQVTSLLDFQELSRQALADHWSQRSPQEQKEFVEILRQLIERSYLRQARSNINYKMTYKSETLHDKGATVTSVVTVTKDNRPENIEIVYELHPVKNGWMVYDVITDDVSILRNYRSQFNRIIKKDSYKVLVEKMRKKLDTMEEAS